MALFTLTREGKDYGIFPSFNSTVEFILKESPELKLVREFDGEDDTFSLGDWKINIKPFQNNDDGKIMDGKELYEDWEKSNLEDIFYNPQNIARRWDRYFSQSNIYPLFYKKTRIILMPQNIPRDVLEKFNLLESDDSSIRMNKELITHLLTTDDIKVQICEFNDIYLDCWEIVKNENSEEILIKPEIYIANEVKKSKGFFPTNQQFAKWKAMMREDLREIKFLKS